MSAQTISEWVPTFDTFAARLGAVRLAQKMNVSQAALSVGVLSESWRKWERGRRPQDLEATARLISDALGVSYVWLISGQEPPRQGPAAQSRCSVPPLKSHRPPIAGVQRPSVFAAAA